MIRLTTISSILAAMFVMTCRERRAVQEEQVLVSPQEMVLPPEVGQTVEKVIKGESLRKKMPPNWIVESVQIKAQEIVVTCTGEGEQRGEVVLGLKSRPGGQEGKWFSIRVVGPQELSLIGEEIDKGFEINPWRPPKREKPDSQQAPPQPGPLGPPPQTRHMPSAEEPYVFPKSVAFTGVIAQVAFITFALVHALKD